MQDCRADCWISFTACWIFILAPWAEQASLKRAVDSTPCLKTEVDLFVNSECGGLLKIKVSKKSSSLFCNLQTWQSASSWWWGRACASESSAWFVCVLTAGACHQHRKNMWTLGWKNDPLSNFWVFAKIKWLQRGGESLSFQWSVVNQVHGSKDVGHWIFDGEAIATETLYHFSTVPDCHLLATFKSD
jgi:hypothetical protein